jgi:hypothetical protein
MPKALAEIPNTGTLFLSATMEVRVGAADGDLYDGEGRLLVDEVSVGFGRAMWGHSLRLKKPTRFFCGLAGAASGTLFHKEEPHP